VAGAAAGAGDDGASGGVGENVRCEM
jgi:hypothetical protein